QVDLAVGSGDIGMADCELDVRRVARKSIVVRQPLPAGTVLSAEMLAVKRPGGGIEPDCLDALVGRTLAVDVPGDSLLAWEQLR
ncbi:MAG: hypothetical protein HZB38_16210, partial [Planctomycetes bacterium]|nr:hypothetical protein [Planctomycetota bacterium]